jgi:hypothetical protein
VLFTGDLQPFGAGDVKQANEVQPLVDVLKLLG